MTDYEEILTELGFNLQSYGNSWKTTAVWRDGDNKSAIKIYKDTGVWVDFVEGEKAMPFAALLTKMGVKDGKYNLDKIIKYRKSELLDEEKIFPDNCLGRLLPEYSFFQAKEKDAPISIATQKAYQCGLATKGRLYNRIVFPIRNKEGKIHGFTGRDISGRSTIKWLHDGRSNDWFYPYYNLKETRETIEETGQIIIVESIGDSMACFQAGLPNNAVTFTNSILPRLAAHISALNVNTIIGCNNDFQKPVLKNEGLKGGLNSLLKLYQLIDFKKLWFMPPKETSDFGEMKGDKITDHFRITYDDEEHKRQMARAISLSESVGTTKTLRPVLNRFKKEWDFYYG